MSIALALTLGHNSSAILINYGQVICGYEEERFTQVKSESKFPINSIRELSLRYDIPQDVDICVGHWFLDHNLPCDTKYWDPEYLQQLFPKSKIYSLNLDFTHHDSHFESAKVFAGPKFSTDYYSFIFDGFGSSGECISVYKTDASGSKLVNRFFGFHKSLGLLYQYATAFLGMKMHNHEYKMLAYEVGIHDIGEHKLQVDELILYHSHKWIDKIYDFSISKLHDPLISLDALVNTRVDVEDLLSSVLDGLNLLDSDILTKRRVISYFVQGLVENVVINLIKSYSPTDVLLCGGLFYNVKLNSLVSKVVKGKTCIMPLAGDQGAGLGVYQKYFGDLKWPEHLFWGHRDLDFSSEDNQLVVVDSEDQALPLIIQELSTIGFVNLVRGSMEYGPRALCNTSTLALPLKHICDTINRLNNRTNEMPFALVVNTEQANDLFEDVDKIHKSLEYMICTRDFKPNAHSLCIGGAHYYPDREIYTCRPQITSDTFMLTLLQEFGPLVNTSFNYHGVPIVLGEEQIKFTHNNQVTNDPFLNFKTIVIRSK